MFCNAALAVVTTIKTTTISVRYNNNKLRIRNVLAVSSSKVLRIQLKRYKRTHSLALTHTYAYAYPRLGKQKSRSTVIRLWIFRHINAKYLQRSQNESNSSCNVCKKNHMHYHTHTLTQRERVTIMATQIINYATDEMSMH